MQKFIKRRCESAVKQYLAIFPTVTILGPRQCGKSTLIKMMGSGNFSSFLYLDLQNPDDLNKLSEPMLFFEANRKTTICLDEIQQTPNLFSVLRSVIDKDRYPGRFILLGSASKELIQKTSETLAGRVGFINLTPFTIDELQNDYNLHCHWFRGGFPESYLSANDTNAGIWLDNYIRTFVERDIPQLGFQTPAIQIRRFMMMSAHNQGQLLNSSKLGEALGVTHPTVRRYLDMTEQTFIMRSLPPYEANLKKRLVKSPRVYIRDSGILHKLLQIPDFNGLMGHPVLGASWEGFVIENIISRFPDFDYFFYRTSSGNELDLIMQTPRKRIAIECKVSTAPQLTKGNWEAIEEVKPDETFVIAPIADRYYLKEKVTAINLLDFLKEIVSLHF